MECVTQELEYVCVCAQGCRYNTRAGVCVCAHGVWVCHTGAGVCVYAYDCVCVSHKGYCVCVHVRARMAVGVPNGCCVREYVCKYDCVCYTGAGVHMHMGTRVPETC